MTIGDRLKTIRTRDGVKQDEFARKMGVNKNTIGRWERGEQVPDADALNNILNHYPDIDPAWLLTGEGEMLRKGSASVCDMKLLATVPPFVNDAMPEYVRPTGLDRDVELIRDIVEMYISSMREKKPEEPLERTAKNIAMIFRYFMDNPDRYGDEVDVSIYIDDWFF